MGPLVITKQLRNSFDIAASLHVGPAGQWLLSVHSSHATMQFKWVYTNSLLFVLSFYIEFVKRF